jgi:signal transduction histidine kinase
MRVFERFTRLDDARTREAGGSGLGLALAQEIALAHSGGLEVFSNELGGARLRLRLPLASDSALVSAAG